ncbi:MAG: NAD-dependent epimerase/dehydratase family protein [Thermoleophilia bacterium]
MNSLVVGGAGFVGSWVVENLLKETDGEIFIVDNLLSSEKSNVSSNSRVHFVMGSASDENVLNKVDTKVDKVFHLSCFHGNQSSIEDPLMDLENNMKPTLTVLNWVEKRMPSSRVVYTGAGCAVAPKTWDAPTGVPEVDETPLLHDSPYSISKVTGEMYAKYFADRRGLDVVRVRFQNAYGPREILGAGEWRGTIHTVWRNVIPTFIWKAINNEDLTLYGAGESSRDFVYVDDLSKGVIAASNRGVKGEVYNLASGQEFLIKDVARKIIELSKSGSKLHIEDRREWDHSGRRFGDPTKSANQLKFRTSTEFENGILETIEWTKSNYDLIQGTINKHKTQMSV